MTPVEVLKAAKARIEQGWCQGNYTRRTDPSGVIRYCVIGALHNIPGYSYEYSTASEIVYLQKALKEISGVDTLVNLPAWNDNPSRIQADVVNLYTRAIELAELGETR